MRRILPLLLLLTAFSVQAKPLAILLPYSYYFAGVSDTSGKSKQPVFYLRYTCSLLGVSLTSHTLPVLNIKGTRLRYTYEDKSYGKGKGKRVEKISHGLFRQSSIDSITNLIASLKESTIQRINPFVMSGCAHFLTIANGADTTTFQLTNTFDHTALKIVDIINQYLPPDKKLWPTEALIIQEKESWEWFNQEIEKKTKDSATQKGDQVERLSSTE